MRKIALFVTQRHIEIFYRHLNIKSIVIICVYQILNEIIPTNISITTQEMFKLYIFMSCAADLDEINSYIILVFSLRREIILYNRFHFFFFFF